MGFAVENEILFLLVAIQFCGLMFDVLVTTFSYNNFATIIIGSTLKL